MSTLGHHLWILLVSPPSLTVLWSLLYCLHRLVTAIPLSIWLDFLITGSLWLILDTESNQTPSDSSRRCTALTSSLSHPNSSIPPRTPSSPTSSATRPECSPVPAPPPSSSTDSPSPRQFRSHRQCDASASSVFLSSASSSSATADVFGPVASPPVQGHSLPNTTVSRARPVYSSPGTSWRSRAAPRCPRTSVADASFKLNRAYEEEEKKLAATPAVPLSLPGPIPSSSSAPSPFFATAVYPIDACPTNSPSARAEAPVAGLVHAVVFAGPDPAVVVAKLDVAVVAEPELAEAMPDLATVPSPFFATAVYPLDASPTNSPSATAEAPVPGLDHAVVFAGPDPAVVVAKPDVAIVAEPELAEAMPDLATWVSDDEASEDFAMDIDPVDPYDGEQVPPSMEGIEETMTIQEEPLLPAFMDVPPWPPSPPSTQTVQVLGAWWKPVAFPVVASTAHAVAELTTLCTEPPRVPVVEQQGLAERWLAVAERDVAFAENDYAEMEVDPPETELDYAEMEVDPAETELDQKLAATPAVPLSLPGPIPSSSSAPSPFFATAVYPIDACPTNSLSARAEAPVAGLDHAVVVAGPDPAVVVAKLDVAVAAEPELAEAMPDLATAPSPFFAPAIYPVDACSTNSPSAEAEAPVAEHDPAETELDPAEAWLKNTMKEMAGLGELDPAAVEAAMKEMADWAGAVAKPTTLCAEPPRAPAVEQRGMEERWLAVAELDPAVAEHDPAETELNPAETALDPAEAWRQDALKQMAGWDDLDPAELERMIKEMAGLDPAELEAVMKETAERDLAERELDPAETEFDPAEAWLEERIPGSLEELDSADLQDIKEEMAGWGELDSAELEVAMTEMAKWVVFLKETGEGTETPREGGPWDEAARETAARDEVAKEIAASDLENEASDDFATDVDVVGTYKGEQVSPSMGLIEEESTIQEESFVPAFVRVAPPPPPTPTAQDPRARRKPIASPAVVSPHPWQYR
ncbi:hypothetical protein JCM5296_002552 [Sporobolomyces johnsonii]